MTKESYDFLIVGGGIFGVYAAVYLNSKGRRVCLVEKEAELLKKASIINQARLHAGYHYPRSVATARIADTNKARFTEEHKQFINFQFEKYYAIEKYGSFTDARQFRRFCRMLDLKADVVKSHPMFDMSRLEELYLTEEYSFDPILIAEYYKSRLKEAHSVEVCMQTTVSGAAEVDNEWEVELRSTDGTVRSIRAAQVINATYCATNTINRLFGVREIALMHEITEIAMVYSEALQDKALTVMDGHFCSIMPYGLSNLLSLSSVTYTHQKVSYELEPVFDCQQINTKCRPGSIEICNTCPAKPPSNQHKMMCQVRKYLTEAVDLKYILSMYTIKAKLQSSYIDDGRPTEINKLHDSPGFYCLFAGKINSIYEIETEVEL